MKQQTCWKGKFRDEGLNREHDEYHITLFEFRAHLADSSFDAESLTYPADTVVTIAGTAGLEYAAYSRTPPILAGTTFYSGFGFTIEPKTEAEYFHVLATIEYIDRLTTIQQNTARMIFLYEWKYAYMPFSWTPNLTDKEIRDSG